MCGVLEEQEFSAMDIGKSVRKMHEALKCKIFSKLFEGTPLPDGFRENVDNLVDSLDEDKVGY